MAGFRHQKVVELQELSNASLGVCPPRIIVIPESMQCGHPAMQPCVTSSTISMEFSACLRQYPAPAMQLVPCPMQGSERIASFTISMKFSASLRKYPAPAMQLVPCPMQGFGRFVPSRPYGLCKQSRRGMPHRRQVKCTQTEGCSCL